MSFSSGDFQIALTIVISKTIDSAHKAMGGNTKINTLIGFIFPAKSSPYLQTQKIKVTQKPMLWCTIMNPVTNRRMAISQVMETKRWSPVLISLPLRIPFKLMTLRRLNSSIKLDEKKINKYLVHSVDTPIGLKVNGLLNTRESLTTKFHL